MVTDAEATRLRYNARRRKQRKATRARYKPLTPKHAAPALGHKFGPQLTCQNADCEETHPATTPCKDGGH